MRRDSAVRPRPCVAMVLAAVAVSLAGLAAPAIAAGGSARMSATCEPQVALSIEATAAYDTTYGRYLDGIISNDSSVTVDCPVVTVTWAEDPERVDYAWPRGDGMEPGQWTAFHVCWPEEVPDEWTPIVSAGGWETDRAALRLQVDAVSEAIGGDISATCEDDKLRSYVATVTNTTGVPVSSIELVGAEWIGDQFVDATFSSCPPSKLEPGASAQIEFHAKAVASSTPTPDIFVEARERPTITLAADTLAPLYGSPITFTLRLTNAEGDPILGSRTLKLFYSADQKCWKYVPKQTETGVAVVTFVPDRPLYFKALFWGDERYGMTESAVVKAVPVVANSKPKAPDRVGARHHFKVTGRMSAGARSAGALVKVHLYRYNRSRHKWVYKSTARVKPDATGRYVGSPTAGSAGSWRVRAYRTGVGYSKYEYVKVR